MVLIMNKSDVKLVLVIILVILVIYFAIQFTKVEGSTAIVYYENEVIRKNFGFIEIGISSEYELLINNVPVKLKGINHHVN